jgi:hypothetical protein
MIALASTGEKDRWRCQRVSPSQKNGFPFLSRKYRPFPLMARGAMLDDVVMEGM